MTARARSTDARLTSSVIAPEAWPKKAVLRDADGIHQRVWVPAGVPAIRGALGGDHEGSAACKGADAVFPASCRGVGGAQDVPIGRATRLDHRLRGQRHRTVHVSGDVIRGNSGHSPGAALEVNVDAVWAHGDGRGSVPTIWMTTA